MFVDLDFIHIFFFRQYQTQRVEQQGAGFFTSLSNMASTVVLLWFRTMKNSYIPQGTIVIKMRPLVVKFECSVL